MLAYKYLYVFPIDKHRHTYRYISCEISIEQPSVGLASLTQLLYSLPSLLYQNTDISEYFYWYLNLMGGIPNKIGGHEEGGEIQC